MNKAHSQYNKDGEERRGRILQSPLIAHLQGPHSTCHVPVDFRRHSRCKLYIYVSRVSNNELPEDTESVIAGF